MCFKLLHLDNAISIIPSDVVKSRIIIFFYVHSNRIEGLNWYGSSNSCPKKTTTTTGPECQGQSWSYSQSRAWGLPPPGNEVGAPPHVPGSSAESFELSPHPPPPLLSWSVIQKHSINTSSIIWKLQGNLSLRNKDTPEWPSIHKNSFEPNGTPEIRTHLFSLPLVSLL